MEQLSEQLRKDNPWPLKVFGKDPKQNSRYLGTAIYLLNEAGISTDNLFGVQRHEAWNLCCDELAKRETIAPIEDKEWIESEALKYSKRYINKLNPNADSDAEDHFIAGANAYATRTQQDKQLEPLPVIEGEEPIIIEEVRYACVAFYNWFREANSLDVIEEFDEWIKTRHGQSVMRMFTNYSTRAKQLEKENEELRRLVKIGQYLFLRATNKETRNPIIEKIIEQLDIELKQNNS